METVADYTGIAAILAASITSMKLLVEPIYGWGWTDLQGQSVDVPGPFVLNVSVQEEGQPFNAATGRLDDQCDHPLRGLWIVLSQRHAVNDGQYNLTASDVEHGHSEPLRDVANFGIMGFATAREA
jgi:hypothetical protein